MSSPFNLRDQSTGKPSLTPPDAAEKVLVLGDEMVNLTTLPDPQLSRSRYSKNNLLQQYFKSRRETQNFIYKKKDTIAKEKEEKDNIELNEYYQMKLIEEMSNTFSNDVLNS